MLLVMMVIKMKDAEESTNHQAALTADDVWRLCDVCSVQQVVIRVTELAVSQLQPGQKVFQHLIVDLPSHNTTHRSASRARRRQKNHRLDLI